MLFFSRRFFPLFVTQFLGALNDNFFKNALVILITYKAQSILGLPSAQMVSLAGGIFILPFFLFSGTAGQLADKYEKGDIIRLVKLAEIFFMILAFVGLYFEIYPLLLAVLFLMGLHSAVFGPIKYSILPQHLEPSELLTGNAYVEAGTFVAILFGTVLGGILIAFEPGGTVYTGIGLVVVAVLGWVSSRWIPDANSDAGDLAIDWNPVSSTKNILREAFLNRQLLPILFGISWFWFVGAMVLALLPTYSKEVLRANEAVVTMFLTLFSIGIATGASACGRLSRFFSQRNLILFGAVGMSIFLVPIALNPARSSEPVGLIDLGFFFHKQNGTWLSVCFFFFSVFGGIFTVPLYTLLQKLSPVAERSRVVAANNVINALFMVGSSLFLVAFLAREISIQVIWGLLAGWNLLMSALIYRGLIFLNDTPNHPEEELHERQPTSFRRRSD